MFSKLHPHQQQQQQQQQPFQFSRECQTSEDDDSPSSGGPTTAAAAQKPASGGDGATIEVVRRPRGRPPGSKNKPKPPLIITREPEPAMSPFILEISGGSDVVEALARFSSRKNTGLCILTASGTVANVTLRQPSVTPGATVTFHGRFDILSMSATFLLSPAIPPGGFAVSLAGPQGQIVGGLVVGRLLAAGTVFVIAASFNNPSYHRLSSSSEDAQNNSGGGDSQSPPVSGGGAESGRVQAESCMYSSHLPSDVIWAPTARPPF
ncbi:AT-hook motif nuclear-localized protein 17 [Spatholobus suberectus]|nr:AT-hook motif nuclear-localized protein 17 [Spatholobus suberectus]